MSTHAREHWLQLAAEAAVKEALSRHALRAEIEDELIDCDITDAPHRLRSAAMESWHRTAIAHAADALIRAERLHRRVVQGQGGGE